MSFIRNACLLVSLSSLVLLAPVDTALAKSRPVAELSFLSIPAAPRASLPPGIHGGQPAFTRAPKIQRERMGPRSQDREYYGSPAIPGGYYGYPTIPGSVSCFTLGSSTTVTIGFPSIYSLDTTYYEPDWQWVYWQPWLWIDGRWTTPGWFENSEWTQQGTHAYFGGQTQVSTTVQGAFRQIWVYNQYWWYDWYTDDWHYDWEWSQFHCAN